MNTDKEGRTDQRTQNSLVHPCWSVFIRGLKILQLTLAATTLVNPDSTSTPSNRGSPSLPGQSRRDRPERKLLSSAWLSSVGGVRGYSIDRAPLEKYFPAWRRPG